MNPVVMILLVNIVTLLACAADGITTRKFAVKHGRAVELNQWLYGVYPTWWRLIAVYSAEMALLNGLDILTHHHLGVLIARFAMAAAHGWAAFHNTRYY